MKREKENDKNIQKLFVSWLRAQTRLVPDRNATRGSLVWRAPSTPKSVLEAEARSALAVETARLVEVPQCALAPSAAEFVAGAKESASAVFRERARLPNATASPRDAESARTRALLAVEAVAITLTEVDAKTGVRSDAHAPSGFALSPVIVPVEVGDAVVKIGDHLAPLR